MTVKIEELFLSLENYGFREETTELTRNSAKKIVR